MADKDRLKWDAIHHDRGFFPATTPSSLIVDCEKFLPACGKALDVAGGSGRHALWLAELGFEVTLADISPIALKIAEAEARRQSLPLKTICKDLELDSFPRGPWEVILCFHYLERRLFADFATTLSEAGVLLFVQPTRMNLERHPRPSERYLLEAGELKTLSVEHGLQILHYEEGWLDEGRHEAVLVARRKQCVE